MGQGELIRDLPKALLSWYKFKKKSKALFVSGAIPESEVLFDMLKDNDMEVVRVTTEECMLQDGCFDYIIMTGTIEISKKPIELLRHSKKMLAEDGKLFIAADNRLAIRYFCGDKDILSGHVLDGIDNYTKVGQQRMEKIGGHSYAKAELRRMFSLAGFDSYQFFSVMPGVERPQLLISENYLPNESLDVRIFPQYKSPETIFLEEERLYASLIENNMFHQMANGFLIECSKAGKLTGIDQVTIQGDRSREEALATIILSKKQVIKRALYKDGENKISQLLDNSQYLEAHKVPMVTAKVEKNEFIMPYVEGKIATEYFRELLRTDKDRFIDELKRFREIIHGSSEQISYEKINWRQFEPGWEKRKMDDPNIDKWEKLIRGSEEDRKNIGVILERGYVDMASLNCFYSENDFVFFDQEFYVERFPANAIFIRTVDFIYRDCYEMEKIYPKEQLLKEFHLFEHQNTWRRFGNDFLERLRNEKALLCYHKKTRHDLKMIAANRHRMDYEQEEYNRLFKDIFKGIANKKIYLFGSGRYSEQFIEQFGKSINISGIIDNKKDKWGTTLSGIEIYSPDVLSEIDVPFKVFICIKFFEEVLAQLKAKNVRDISIYDPRLEYDRPEKPVYKQERSEPKRYRVGYIAGVFDLFHVGHLNLFKRAKALCEYLIVGVVSDEQVMNSKKTSPYIPFEERLEIVQSCKYVDEAVGIPVDKPDTEDAYRLYHFDVQFSGSDYADDPVWLGKKEYLQQHGSDLVFFPYTQSTSSTKLKGKIRETGKQ